MSNVQFFIFLNYSCRGCDQLLRRRVDCFIEFSGFDRQRIVNWLFSKAVLAAWWTVKDSGVADKKFIQCAEAVEKMLCQFY